MSQCSFCEKDSTYDLTICDQGVFQQVNFCPTHAEDINNISDIDFKDSDQDILGEILTKDLAFQSKIQILDSDFKEGTIKACPNCGMDLDTIRETGFFGCDLCYGFFEKELKPIFPEEYKKRNEG